MTSRAKNVSASVREKLLNRARQTGRPFNELLQYFGMERFLYRLSKSRHADKFILHLDYMVDLVGLEHVRLGTDFFGFSLPQNPSAKINELLGRPEHRASFTEKLEGFEKYTLIAGLKKRRYSDSEIEKLAGRNFLSVFRQVVG
jgi:microsomal dipeptidase-like Zn-dependent dipeptidase